MLEESLRYLEGEVVRRGITSEEKLTQLYEELMSDDSDLVKQSAQNWQPETNEDGEWRMQPVLMD